MRTWVFTPHSGGTKITAAVAERTRKEIIGRWRKGWKGVIRKVEIRFKAQFCYVDIHVDADKLIPLCRLRYLGFRDEWSLALYDFSSRSYEPALFPKGEDCGSAQEGFKVAASYLREQSLLNVQRSTRDE